MASLKECRARAKQAGFKLVKLPERSSAYKHGLRYRVNGYHAKTVQELSQVISQFIRQEKHHKAFRQLNGHRLKYGYKTVARKRGVK